MSKKPRRDVLIFEFGTVTFVQNSAIRLRKAKSVISSCIIMMLDGKLSVLYKSVVAISRSAT